MIKRKKLFYKCLYSYIHYMPIKSSNLDIIVYRYIIYVLTINRNKKY